MLLVVLVAVLQFTCSMELATELHFRNKLIWEMLDA